MLIGILIAFALVGQRGAVGEAETDLGGG